MRHVRTIVTKMRFVALQKIAPMKPQIVTSFYLARLVSVTSKQQLEMSGNSLKTRTKP